MINKNGYFEMMRADNKDIMCADSSYDVGKDRRGILLSTGNCTRETWWGQLEYLGQWKLIPA